MWVKQIVQKGLDEIKFDFIFIRFIIIIITYFLTYFLTCLLTYLLTIIEFSLDGSSPYSSTDNTNKNKYT